MRGASQIKTQTNKNAKNELSRLLVTANRAEGDQKHLARVVRSVPEFLARDTLGENAY